MSSSSSESDEDILIALACEEMEKRKQRFWIYNINLKRETHEEFYHLFPDLLGDDDKFFQYFRMSSAKFYELIQILPLRKQDTNYRKAISPEDRLAVTLKLCACCLLDLDECYCKTASKTMSQVEVVLEDLSTHPSCPHGPTILFSRILNGKCTRFFACSACRDRKDCSFYLCEEEKNKVNDVKKKRWEDEKQRLIQGINHRKLFLNMNRIKQQQESLRQYCHDCFELVDVRFQHKHVKHKIVKGISDFLFSHPSQLFSPLDNGRKEAQFLFSSTTVETIADIIQEQGCKNVICIGAPRIHEYITYSHPNMNSILLDIDKRYLSFLGPLQFCWYNMFNHFFFLPDSEQVFQDFLQNDKGDGMILVTDPPFGGRVELLAETVKTINSIYKSLNRRVNDLPVLWIFPYFMEPQMLNSLPEFSMLDYKVEYENHPLFQDGSKGRKHGSPVRIFTNIDYSTITLPEDQGYKHCSDCNRMVSLENRHCSLCNSCTSKDGRTYIHCNNCQRCVKPTWLHCTECNRCAQPDHICKELIFTQSCFHCKESGHKKRDCPKVNHFKLFEKRKKDVKLKSKKLKTK